VGPAPGSALPVGTTHVRYQATDTSGNSTECGFNVTVLDNQNPVISNYPQNLTVVVDPDQCSKAVTWTAPTAVDNCAITSFQSNHNPGDLFAVGTTIVSYTATDSNSRTASCSFSVTVVDNQ